MEQSGMEFREDGVLGEIIRMNTSKSRGSVNLVCFIGILVKFFKKPHFFPDCF